jgi:hypothetical protein
VKSRRTRAGLAVLASAALVSSLVGQQLAFADHPVVTLTGSNFEIDVDANLRVDHASPSIDWASVGQTRVSTPPAGPVTSRSAKAPRRTPPSRPS